MNLDHRQHYSKHRMQDLINYPTAHFCAYQNNCAKWGNLIEGEKKLNHAGERWHEQHSHQAKRTKEIHIL